MSPHRTSLFFLDLLSLSILSLHSFVTHHFASAPFLLMQQHFTSILIPAGSLELVGYLKEDEGWLKGPNWIMIRLKEHFKIHYMTDGTDVSSPCRLSTFLFILASAVWLTCSKNSIMSTRRPTDDLLFVCSTYTTHLQQTSCSPTTQIHLKQQLILCYCLLTWHQRHMSPAEAQSMGLTWTRGSNTLVKKGEGAAQSWLVQDP